MFDKLWSSKSLISKSEIEKFIDIYAKSDNWHGQDRKKGSLGYGWWHYAIIRLIKPKRVLCVGSRYGFIPAVCAMACRDNGTGIVDFVDAGYDIGDYRGPGEHWGGVGWWRKCNPKKYFGKFGLDKYIELYVMKSENFFQKFKDRTFDYVHIDGDHSYQGVKLDFKMFWPKVTSGGFLAIHDIGSPDKDGNVYGTRRFWTELKKERKAFWEIMENPGLGVIQK